MITKSDFQVKNANAELVATLDIANDVWKEAQNKTLVKLAKKVDVSGFRKGKVPLAVAKRYISSYQIFNEAVMSLLQDIGKEASALIPKEQRVIAGPSYDIAKISNEELTLKFNYPLYPTIKLVDLKKVQIPFTEKKVSALQIEEKLKKAQKSLAMVKPVERPIKKGDQVVMDFEGFIDGEPFEDNSSKDFRYEVGSKKLIADFENGIIRMKANEKKRIKVTFPKDYIIKELRNEKGEFDVHIKKTEEIEVSPLNDELAKDLNLKGVNNLKELKNHYQKEIADENHRKAIAAFEKDLLQFITKNSDIPLHPTLVAKEAEKVAKEFNDTLKQQKFTLPNYLKLANISEEDLKKNHQKEASSNLKQSFALQALIDKLNVKLDKQELEAEYDQLATLYKMEKEQLKKIFPQENLEFPILKKKAIELMIEKNKSTKSSPAKKTASKTPTSKKITTKKK